MINDLGNLFLAEEKTKRWTAEWENAAARMLLAEFEERMLRLLSQQEPIASMQVDREKLRAIFDYIRIGHSLKDLK